MPFDSGSHGLAALVEFLAANYSFGSEDRIEFASIISGGALFYGFRALIRGCSCSTGSYSRPREGPRNLYCFLYPSRGIYKVKLKRGASILPWPLTL